MIDKNKYFDEEYKDVIAFSVKEVARLLQLPLSTVAYYCKENVLPCLKIGRHYRIMKADLIRFIEERKADSIIL